MVSKINPQRASEYELKASHWLAEANQASEIGKKEQAEKLYTKAQYWLDRANAARGWN